MTLFVGDVIKLSDFLLCNVVCDEFVFKRFCPSKDSSIVLIATDCTGQRILYCYEERWCILSRSLRTKTQRVVERIVSMSTTCANIISECT